jgi:hypothetical protein
MQAMSLECAGESLMAPKLDGLNYGRDKFRRLLIAGPDGFRLQYLLPEDGQVRYDDGAAARDGFRDNA